MVSPIDLGMVVRLDNSSVVKGVHTGSIAPSTLTVAPMQEH